MFETRQPELRDLSGWDFAEDRDDYFTTPTRASPDYWPAAMTAEYVETSQLCPETCPEPSSQSVAQTTACGMDAEAIDACMR